MTAEPLPENVVPDPEIAAASEVDENNLYWVNLSLKIAAPDPSTAVRAFIEGIVQQGLRDFAYSVENYDDREIAGVFDGFGDRINPLELVESQEGVSTPESERAELLALAERLNKTNDPAAPAAP